MAKKPYETTTITAENWSSELKIFDGTARSQRRAFQGFLIFALDDYANGSESSGKMLQLYKRAGNFGFDKTRVLSFITAHANVKLENEGKKNAKFVNRSKKIGNGVKPVSDWWYTFEPAKSDKPEVKSELNKMLDGFMARVNKADADGKLKEGEHEKVEAFMTYLKAYEGLNEVDHVAPEVKAITKPETVKTTPPTQQPALMHMTVN